MADKSRPERDWVGLSTGRTEHLDEKGNVTHTSEPERNVFGFETGRTTYKANGDVTGHSEPVSGGILGEDKVLHTNAKGEPTKEAVHHGRKTEVRNLRKQRQASGGGDYGGNFGTDMPSSSRPSSDTRRGPFLALFALQGVWLIAILYLLLRPPVSAPVKPAVRATTGVRVPEETTSSVPVESVPIETQESLKNKALIERATEGEANLDPIPEMVPLASLQPITDNDFPNPSEGPFSMSAQVFEFGFISDSYDAFAVYDLDGLYKTLRFVIGAADSYYWDNDDNHVLAVSVDGVVKETERWQTRPNLKTVTIDLTGAESLAITLGPSLGLGEPILER